MGDRAPPIISFDDILARTRPFVVDDASWLPRNQLDAPLVVTAPHVWTSEPLGKNDKANSVSVVVVRSVRACCRLWLVSMSFLVILLPPRCPGPRERLAGGSRGHRTTVAEHVVDGVFAACRDLR